MISNTPTLQQFLLQHLSDHADQKDLVMIMSDLATIGKFISHEVNRAGVTNILGAAGSTNVQDEEVQKLDVFANETCKQYLKQTGHFAALASEEEEHPVDMGEYGVDAKYVVAFDPLDGSSNIDVNVSVGTIFSVHARLQEMDRVAEEQFLQKGSAQVLAGYVLYGSSTVLVFSFGDGVHEFTLDPNVGEFLLSNEQMRVPQVCNIYSVNEGKAALFRQKDRDYIQQLKDSGVGSRYIGSLVADFHRNLIKGGIFMYPELGAADGTYKGKLRLNYELKPMAFLLKQAGGLAIDGTSDILEVKPTSLHARSGVIMGNAEVVLKYNN